MSIRNERTEPSGHVNWLKGRIDARDRAIKRAGFKWSRRADGEFELVRDRDVAEQQEAE